MQFNFDYELLNVRALYYPGSGLNPQTAFGCEMGAFPARWAMVEEAAWTNRPSRDR